MRVVEVLVYSTQTGQHELLIHDVPPSDLEGYLSRLADEIPQAVALVHN